MSKYDKQEYRCDSFRVLLLIINIERNDMVKRAKCIKYSIDTI